MKNWKLSLLASASGVVLAAGSAVAADLPVRAPTVAPIPYVSWTGGYIGAHIGVGTQHSACGNNAGSGWGCDQWITSGTTEARSSAFLGGVEAGYDWQNRNFVYGVAADWTWTNLKKSVTGGSGSTSYESKVNWLASFRGRAGIAIDDTLVYMTGGLALGGVKDTVNYMGWRCCGSSSLSSSSTQAGWVAGAGVEHRWDRNWSVKLEYLHYELAEHSASGSVPGTSGAKTTHLRFDHTIDVGRVGINYRF